MSGLEFHDGQILTAQIVSIHQFSILGGQLHVFQFKAAFILLRLIQNKTVHAAAKAILDFHPAVCDRQLLCDLCSAFHMRYVDIIFGFTNDITKTGQQAIFIISRHIKSSNKTSGVDGGKGEFPAAQFQEDVISHNIPGQPTAESDQIDRKDAIGTQLAGHGALLRVIIIGDICIGAETNPGERTTQIEIFHIQEFRMPKLAGREDIPVFAVTAPREHRNLDRQGDLIVYCHMEHGRISI